MTAITGKVAITKRPGELGIHSMDTFSMMVPDLKVAEHFYRSFGLDVREEGQGLGIYTFGSDHRWVSLDEGPRKKLNHLSFAVFEEDFDPIRRRIEANGVRIMDAPRASGRDSNGFWIQDPFGMSVEIKIAEKTSPDAKVDFLTTSCEAGRMGSVSRSRAPKVEPRRLAHLLVFTPSVPDSLAFYARNGDMVKGAGRRAFGGDRSVVGLQHGLSLPPPRASRWCQRPAGAARRRPGRRRDAQFRVQSRAGVPPAARIAAM